MALQRGRSAATTEVQLSPIRSLTRPELALLAEKRSEKPIIQKLRDPHHRVARMIAAGLKHVEVAELCGMSYSRINILTKDPAFLELVAHYRGQVTEAFIRSQDQFMELATTNMLKAETMLAEKLEAAEETGEFLPTRDLIAISRDAADRFGYGKKNLNVNVNVDFAAKLEDARKRSSRVVELRPATVVAPLPQSAPVRNLDSSLPAQGLPPLRRRV